MTTYEQWRREFRALRLMADLKELIELEECRHAAARLRVAAVSQSFARQVWPDTQFPRRD